jgi:HD-GYP domain-containing protein (c-di-GMP phosphodiesterase class II)
MDEADLNDATIYCEHLADVNKTNVVKTTENIYNDNGLLIVAKGAQLNSSMAEKIARHRLNTPLEHSVSVGNSIGAQALYLKVDEIVHSRPDLIQIHRVNELEQILIKACQFFSRYNILKQKITVLAIKLPDIYEKSIMGAWFALGIAKKLQSTDVDPREAFVSALVRDLGYLHLPPHILEENANLNDDDIKAIRSHTLVGELILKEIKGIPRSIVNGVSEHHERWDGMGYPKNKTYEKLSKIGQVVAMANEIQNLCVKNKNRVQLSVGNVLHYLNFNVVTHFEQIYKAAHLLLKSSNIAPVRYVEDSEMASFLNNLVRLSGLYVQLHNSGNEIMKILEILENDESDKIKQIGYIIKSVNKSLTESGLLSDEYTRWISHVAENNLQPAFVEMESVGMIFDGLEKEYRSILLGVKSLRVEDVKEGSWGKIQEEIKQMIDVAEQLSNSYSEAPKLTLF